MKGNAIVINECYSDNIGDQAIADAMCELVKSSGYSRVDNADFSFRKKLQRHKRTSVSPKSRSFLSRLAFLISFWFLFKNLSSAFQLAKKRYRVAFIGGGQLILGNRTFPISMFLLTLSLKLFGTKVYIVSVGVGEQFTFFQRALYKLSLRLAYKVLVRDLKSQRKVKTHFSVDAEFIPDSAYYLTTNDREEPLFTALICPVEYSVYSRYRGEVGNTLLSEKSYSAYWVNDIRKGLKESSSRIVISGTTLADFEFSKKLKSFLSIEELSRIEFIYPESWPHFVDLASKSKEVTSGRMHALILAHIAGAQIKPFLISKKLQDYSEEYLEKPPECIREELIRVFQALLKS